MEGSPRLVVCLRENVTVRVPSLPVGVQWEVLRPIEDPTPNPDCKGGDVLTTPSFGSGAALAKIYETNPSLLPVGENAKRTQGLETRDDYTGI